MAKKASSSYDWLRAIQPNIIELQDVSSTGAPEDFSWDRLGQAVAERFELNDVQIQPTRTEWRAEKNAGAGMGRKLVSLRYSVSALPGEAALLLSKNDLNILMAALLTKSANTPAHLDEAFQEGFIHFLAVELTNLMAGVGFEGELILEALDEQEVPQEAGLCQDVEITLCGKAIAARLFANQELTKAWKQRFAGKAAASRPLRKKLIRNIDVNVHFEAGKVEVTPGILKRTRPGDFIILDSCSVLPGEEKGRIVLTVEGIPVFRGMLKEDKIKILEYPLYHKIETAMENDDELDKDEDLEDEEFEEDLEEVDEEDDEEDEGQLGEGTPITERAGDIPITITIELGRIKMKLDKLIDLQPGQLLELEVVPEEGVDLVVNGRCIGRGELLKLGEALGVRVLELA